MPLMVSSAARALLQDLIQDRTPTPRRSAVRSVTINVTDRCNLACTYCFAGGGNYGRPLAARLTEESARTLVNNIVSAFPDLSSVKFFGGEPLLNAVAIDAICDEFKLATEGGRLATVPSFGTVSNFTRFTPQVGALLLRNSIQVTVIVDGPSEIHDASRLFPSGRGSFQLVRRNIGHFRDMGGDIGIECVYSDLHRRAGCSPTDLHLFLESTFSPSAILITPEIVETAQAQESDTLREEWLAYGDFLAERTDLRSCRHMVQALLARILAEDGDARYCSAGFDSVTITSDGTLTPCYQFIEDGFFLGSDWLTPSPILDTSGGPLQLLATQDKRKSPSCAACDIKYFCHQCPAVFLHYGDGLDEPIHSACYGTWDCTKGYFA